MVQLEEIVLFHITDPRVVTSPVLLDNLVRGVVDVPCTPAASRVLGDAKLILEAVCTQAVWRLLHSINQSIVRHG